MPTKTVPLLSSRTKQVIFFRGSWGISEISGFVSAKLYRQYMKEGRGGGMPSRERVSKVPSARFWESGYQKWRLVLYRSNALRRETLKIEALYFSGGQLFLQARHLLRCPVKADRQTIACLLCYDLEKLVFYTTGWRTSRKLFSFMFPGYVMSYGVPFA